MELDRRRILNCNVTDHSSAEWTLQQLREALPDDHPFRFVIHDQDSVFSVELGKAVAAMGVRVLRTPLRAPQGCRCSEWGREGVSGAGIPGPGLM